MAKTPNLPLVAPLRSGTQCDEDGVMNIVSRQACHEAADLIETLYEALADAHAVINILVERGVFGRLDGPDPIAAALSQARGEDQ